MSDWQVGDLAVCVDAGRLYKRDGRLKEGSAYRVVGFGLPDAERTEPFSLFLQGVRAVHQDYGFGFRLARFRKIHPDEQEACEPEFVTLLKRSKRKVSA